MSASRRLLAAAALGVIVFYGEEKRDALRSFDDPTLGVRDCPSKIVGEMAAAVVLTDLAPRGIAPERRRRPRERRWTSSPTDHPRILSLVPSHEDAGHMAFVHSVIERRMPGRVLSSTTAARRGLPSS